MPEPRDIEVFGVNFRELFGGVFNDQLIYGTLFRKRGGRTNPDDINGPKIDVIEETYQVQGFKTIETLPGSDRNNTPVQKVTIELMADLIVGQTRFEPGGGAVVSDFDSDFDGDFGGTRAGLATIPVDSIPEPYDVVEFVGEQTAYRIMSITTDDTGSSYICTTEPHASNRSY